VACEKRYRFASHEEATPVARVSSGLMKKAYIEFRTRWASVKAVQDSELRRLSPNERFDQLVDLFGLRPALRENRSEVRELRVVRRRWAKLRQRHRALA
jgi:hypothetical protein